MVLDGTVNTSHTTTGSEIENRASQISKHGYHHRKNSGIIESRQRRTSYLSDNNKQEDHDENHQRNLNSTQVDANTDADATIRSPTVASHKLNNNVSPPNNYSKRFSFFQPQSQQQYSQQQQQSW